MRDYKVEFEKRVEFIKSILAESGVKGIVYGNSGGKDSALVGILCKAACDNTVGIILPCTSKRNYDEDTVDAKEVAAAENRLVAGTGNRSEAYVGYFTKWGDGAHDFNPIADLTVTEIYDFLRYLGDPRTRRAHEADPGMART